MDYSTAKRFLIDLQAAQLVVERLEPGYQAEHLDQAEIVDINLALVRIGSLFETDRPFREGLLAMEIPKQIDGDRQLVREVSPILLALDGDEISDINAPLLLPTWIDTEEERISLFSILARRIEIQLSAYVYTT